MSEQPATDVQASEVPSSQVALDPRPPITGQKAPITLSPQGGIQLTNTEEAMRFAVILIKSGLAPRGIDTPEKAFICLQLGAELGIPPMAAIQNIAPINGRPSVWGDMMLALVQSSTLCESFHEEMIGKEGDDSWGYICVTKRRGNEHPFKSRFTVADAKRANLWGKTGPWTQYPKRMLQMRARGFALRDAYPDRLKGLITREEAGDMPEKNVTPIRKLDELDAPKNDQDSP